MRPLSNFLLFISFIEKSEKKASKEDMTKYHHEREPIHKPINVQTTESDDQKPIVQHPLSDQPNESDGHPIGLLPDQPNAIEPIIDQTEDSNLSTKRHFSLTCKSNHKHTIL